MGRSDMFYLLGDSGEKIHNEPWVSVREAFEAMQSEIREGTEQVYSVGDQYYIVPKADSLVGESENVESVAVAIVKIVVNPDDDEGISAMLCKPDGTPWR